MPRRTSIARIAVLTALAAVLAACGGPPPPSGPVQVEIDGIATEVLASERFSGVYACGEDQVDVRVTVGTTTAGDDFVLVVPQRDWGGDLVVFAHGYRDPAVQAGFWDVVPDGFPQVLDALGDLGSGDLSGGVGQAMALAVCSFTVDLGIGDPLDKTPSAFAASSYSANGYATEVAVPETHVLNALFARYYPAPERTYVTGASLGALVALELAERYPERYDGALPVCGPVGGSLLQLSYVGHVELMFRYFYPDAFDGGSRENIDLTAPLGLPYGDPGAGSAQGDSVVSRIVEAVTHDPTPLDELGDVEFEDRSGLRRPLLQHDSDTLLESVLEAFFFTAVGKADIVELAGGFPFDNQDVTYYPGTGTDAIVDPVLGYQADAAALAYFADHYQPTGQLRIPAVTVHNLLDPVVPAFHESVYEQLVADEAWDENLATAIVPFDGAGTSTTPFGHCAFAEEVVVAFAALSEWVESGSRPFVLGTLAEDGDPLR